MQCHEILSIYRSAFEFKSALVSVSHVVYPSHQFQKLSQLETMLEGERANLLPTAERIQIRRLADALCHASTIRDKPLADTNRVDATVKVLKQFKANLKRRINAQDEVTSKRLMELPDPKR